MEIAKEEGGWGNNKELTKRNNYPIFFTSGCQKKVLLLNDENVSFYLFLPRIRFIKKRKKEKKS